MTDPTPNTTATKATWLTDCEWRDGSRLCDKRGGRPVLACDDCGRTYCDQHVNNHVCGRTVGAQPLASLAGSEPNLTGGLEPGEYLRRQYADPAPAGLTAAQEIRTRLAEALLSGRRGRILDAEIAIGAALPHIRARVLAEVDAALRDRERFFAWQLHHSIAPPGPNQFADYLRDVLATPAPTHTDPRGTTNPEGTHGEG